MGFTFSMFKAAVLLGMLLHVSAAVYDEDEKIEPGVEVTGAASNVVNGWYAQKTRNEGPPPGSRYSRREWPHVCGSDYWYVNPSGCYIFRDDNSWCIRTPPASRRYAPYCVAPAGERDLPPTQGWRSID